MNDHTTNESTNEIPYGYCHCGCGQKTQISKYTDRSRGYTKGEPRRFVNGHNGRNPPRNEKPCTVCNKLLPITGEFFDRDKRSSDGFEGQCKECRKLLRKGSNKRYYQEHADAKRAYSRQWYSENKERAAANIRSRSTATKTKIAKRKSEYREESKEKIAEYNRRWRAANREIMRAHKRRRRALKLNAEGHHAPEDVRRIYEAQDGKCCYCDCELNGKFHVDHVVPLSRGGSDAADNIAIACYFCNQSKKDKLLSEWKGSSRALKR